MTSIRQISNFYLTAKIDQIISSITREKFKLKSMSGHSKNLTKSLILYITTSLCIHTNTYMYQIEIISLGIWTTCFKTICLFSKSSSSYIDSFNLIQLELL